MVMSALYTIIIIVQGAVIGTMNRKLVHSI